MERIISVRNRYPAAYQRSRTTAIRILEVPPVQPLKPLQLRDWLVEQNETPIVLDVREPWEIAICALPGSIPIPMGEIPERVNELPKNKPIVVICHHGVRSMQVAYYLNDAGFENVYNLTGGIDAWASEVDSSAATY